jgi:threonine/homoserine/homoserine lactone efflux protein
MFLVSLSWYFFVALLVSSRKFQPVFFGFRPVIQSVLGALLIVVGVKVFLG